jgi:hypothetical protein
MHSSHETNADINAVPDDCFEVDDIAAFDPIEAATPAAKPAKPVAAKAASKSKGVAKAAKPASKPAAADDASEIELSAGDMDSLLDDDVISVEIS